MRFDLSDEEWPLLEFAAAEEPKEWAGWRPQNRQCDLLLAAHRNALRDLSARYGHYRTAYNRFNRLSRRGIWKRVFDRLASQSRDSLYLIGSTIATALPRRHPRRRAVCLMGALSDFVGRLGSLTVSTHAGNRRSRYCLSAGGNWSPSGGFGAQCSASHWPFAISASVIFDATAARIRMTFSRSRLAAAPAARSSHI